jgi:hypothetical protein
MFQNDFWIKNCFERSYRFLIRYRPGIFLEWLRDKTRKISQNTKFSGPDWNKHSLNGLQNKDYYRWTNLLILARLFTLYRDSFFIYISCWIGTFHVTFQSWHLISGVTTPAVRRMHAKWLQTEHWTSGF